MKEDRGNVFIIDDVVQKRNFEEETGYPDTGIYLYTHIHGFDWPEMLRFALIDGRDCWDDPAYLTRLIISQMFDDLRFSTTGGGVTPYLTDNDHMITVVDIAHETISWAQAGLEIWPAQRINHMSFSEFIVLDEAEYPPEDTWK